MKKGKQWLIVSIILAVISFVIMKIMYVIDPIDGEGGQITALVFVFINFPFWVLSVVVFSYGLFLTLRKGKASEKEYKGITEEEEEVENAK